MSKSQFQAFYQKAAEDATLKNKMMSLRGTSSEVLPKICQLAQDEGYDVELADITEAFSAEGELEDSVLNEIAGGGCDSSKRDPNCTRVCGECCGTFLGTYIGKQ
ncbi:MAG TPA: Nif11-like leader peptide family RiPP precursor [Candidatus Pullichristensenella excrementigallinarum]|uniref:Nif11-like leader peptide family RiPP n=1 Tax=Candidatus Pullichristensenella excrementigallinarum TaxID=2840907 RepID=A0A9D1IDX9_9FIRM|nr:Nif11-like leader peptide family RiPP precursor [Candidatus Pullichristensenella excrementigallinarum]